MARAASLPRGRGQGLPQYWSSNDGKEAIQTGAERDPSDHGCTRGPDCAHLVRTRIDASCSRRQSDRKSIRGETAESGRGTDNRTTKATSRADVPKSLLSRIE